jgi:hypothetical protein
MAGQSRETATRWQGSREKLPLREKLPQDGRAVARNCHQMAGQSYKPSMIHKIEEQLHSYLPPVKEVFLICDQGQT